jgi:hypothetical protein
MMEGQNSKYVQCNLDLVTLNLVTICDLVTIFQRPFFNLLHKIIRFSDIMRFSDRFCKDQKCHYVNQDCTVLRFARLKNPGGKI